LEVRNRDPDNLWEEIRRVTTEAVMKNTVYPKKETRKVPNGSQKEPLRLQKRDGKQNK
jgi:hypothetical protein